MPNIYRGLLVLCAVTILPPSNSHAQRASGEVPSFAGQIVCRYVAESLGLERRGGGLLTTGGHYAAEVVAGDWNGVLLLRHHSREEDGTCWIVHKTVEWPDLPEGTQVQVGGCDLPTAGMGEIAGRIVAIVDTLADWRSPPQYYNVRRAWYAARTETESAFFLELKPTEIKCATPAGY